MFRATPEFTVMIEVKDSIILNRWDSVQIVDRGLIKVSELSVGDEIIVEGGSVVALTISSIEHIDSCSVLVLFDLRELSDELH